MDKLITPQSEAIALPTLAQIGRLMRNNRWVKRHYRIIDAFVIGSVAKGTAHAQSDIDVAVIIPPVRGKTALKVSEQYHARFTAEHQRPQFNGRVVDLQFFYEGDPCLAEYQTRPLPNTLTQP